MKVVMKSVSPRICEKVANGDCTILVSKTAPKCKVPFKGYICCTSSDVHSALVVGDGDAKLIHCCNYKSAIPVGGVIGNGKVIGEFVCDKIIEWQYDSGHQYYVEYPDDCTSYFPYLKCHSEATGLKCSEIEKLGKGKPLYGLHISDLKIYGKPKELSEFYTIDESGNDCCIACVHHETPLEEMPCRTCTGERRYLYRPPQSWQYVEELEE